jgi:choline dehydrogenase-like flavoprotein
LKAFELFSPKHTELSTAERRTALAFAEAILPNSTSIPGANERSVDRMLSYINGLGPVATQAWLRAQQVMDGAAVAQKGRRFSKLSTGQQQELLASWERNAAMRFPLSLLSMGYKFTHFDGDDVYKALGGSRLKMAPDPSQRWMENIHAGHDWDESETIECDAVVIGTGAGGAVVARELATRGYGVCVVEEGKHIRRDQFRRSMVHTNTTYYRNQLVSMGNALIPIMAGRLVGGSTALNTATCLRPPRWVTDEWAEHLRSDAYSHTALNPYFEQVERYLGVAPNSLESIGPMKDIIARGCDALGYSHYAIPRNAPGCQGEGFCAQGCATDARTSTNLSYMPDALRHGAMLFTELTATRIVVENGRATGIEAVAPQNGKQIRVRARVVVLAAGAIPTPLLLMKQGIGNSSGQLGRNLSLHPSGAFSAQFDERVNAHQHVPQGYGTQQFLNEGLLLSGALADYNIFPSTIALTGDRLMEVVAQRDHIAALGVLTHDQGPGGRVWRGVGGRTIVTYNLTKKDVALLHKGMCAALDIFRAAGAKRFYPLVYSSPMLETEREIREFQATPPAPRDYLLTSFHPLGTCKMGRDPKTSVVNLEQETHDVKNLYIVDGSSVPGAPAVNPQITIMAVATRAAEGIADRLGASAPS